MNLEWDLIVIGSGPAGLTAGIYAGRGNIKVAVLEGDEPGGQLMYTSTIENYPGFVSTGPGLIQAMKAQAEESGAEFFYEKVSSIVKQDKDFAFEIKTESGKTLKAKTVIVATGSNAKWLDVPGIEEFKGKGVSSCATCDGFNVKGRDAAIVGGGNVAVEDAIYLSKICNKVHFIHRRDTLRAEKVLQDRLMELENIEFHWNTEVSQVQGKEEMNLVELTDGNKLEVQGLFIAIGHTPNTSFLGGLLPLDQAGYVDTKSVVTPIKGLYVAGDVMDPHDRQAITSAGYGCTAARKAINDINMN